MHTKVKRKLKHMARVSFYFLQTHWGDVFCTSPSMWRSNSYFQIYMCNEPKLKCNVNSHSVLTGQLVPRTTRTQDNSYPRQLVPRTTRTQDNSYPRRLAPRTTRTHVVWYGALGFRYHRHSVSESCDFVGYVFSYWTNLSSYALLI